MQDHCKAQLVNVNHWQGHSEQSEAICARNQYVSKITLTLSAKRLKHHLNSLVCMKRTLYIPLIVLPFLFLAQSCATVKNVWENITDLPELIRPDEKQPLGYPGVDVFTNESAEENSRSITGFSGIVRHTIYGSEKWEDPLGIQVGVIYPFYSINHFLDLRGEVNFTMQGAKWIESDTKGRTNLIYINTPIVLRYQTDFGLFAEGGLQTGFLISARKYEGTVDNYMVNMRKIDLSIPIGIGFEFKNNFGVGLRMITGLTDISRYSASNDRNLVLALRGTYTFRMK